MHHPDAGQMCSPREGEAMRLKSSVIVGLLAGAMTLTACNSGSSNPSTSGTTGSGATSGGTGQGTAALTIGRPGRRIPGRRSAHGPPVAPRGASDLHGAGGAGPPQSGRAGPVQRSHDDRDRRPFGIHRGQQLLALVRGRVWRAPEPLAALTNPACPAKRRLPRPPCRSHRRCASAELTPCGCD